MITRASDGCCCVPGMAPDATAPPSRNVSSEEIGTQQASSTPKRTTAKMACEMRKLVMPTFVPENRRCAGLERGRRGPLLLLRTHRYRSHRHADRDPRDLRADA